MAPSVLVEFDSLVSVGLAADSSDASDCVIDVVLQRARDDLFDSQITDAQRSGDVLARDVVRKLCRRRRD